MTCHTDGMHNLIVVVEVSDIHIRMFIVYSLSALIIYNRG